MSDLTGKTVASVAVEQWAGTDTFKDDVTWERTVLTFTDGSTAAFDQRDGDTYDPYRAVFDDDGHPHRFVETTTTCRWCHRAIGYSPEEGWVCPEAGFDVEDGDGIWRTTCEDHDTFTAEHEPAETCERHDGPWGGDMTCERCTYEDGTARPLTDKGPLGPGAHEEN